MVDCNQLGMSYSSQPREEDVDWEEVAEFLDKAGAVGLFCVVDLYGRVQFSDLADELPNSTSTLSNRLDEAVDLGLFEIGLDEPQVGGNRIYYLTAVGKNLQHYMDVEGVLKLYDKMRVYEVELDEAVTEIQEYIAEHGRTGAPGKFAPPQDY